MIFSKRVGKLGTRLVQKNRKLVETEPHPTMLSNSLTKNDARRVRNVMEALPDLKKLVLAMLFKVLGSRRGSPGKLFFICCPFLFKTSFNH